MPIPSPVGRPDGSEPQALSSQFSHDAVSHVLRLQRVAGSRVSNTTQGLSIVPEPTAAPSTASKRYRLKNVKGDYLVCHSWDGTTEGTRNVFIAKEELHRESLTAETVLGVAHTYTYADGPSEAWAVGTAATYNRTRTDVGSITEDQRITPPWRENEVFHATQSQTGVTTDVDDGSRVVTLLITGRSCQWAGPIT